MKVFINNQEVELFSGARVKDALMKYSLKEYYLVMEGEKVIVDDMGNRYSLDGEISGGECFTLETGKDEGSDEE